MPRVKKAEREAVAEALMQAQDNLEEASEQAIQALDQVRMQHVSKAANRPYVVLMQVEGQSMVYTFGPYTSKAQATRARDKLVSPGPGQARSVVQRLIEVPE